MRCFALFVLIPLAISGCTKASSSEPAPVAATSETVRPNINGNSEPAPAHAEVGKPAPDFELSDLDGKKIKLSSLRGKVVVLEWFNPECPFVNASHTKGSLVGTAARHIKEGVTWL